MKAPKSNFVFSQVPSVSRPRSTFDRSRYYKSAFDEGYLIPFYLDDVLPGDTFNVKVTAFARLATLVAPFMDNLYLDFFFFFVPNRLVWENWQRFCGEQDNPDDSTDYLVPQINFVSGSGAGSASSTGDLHDYFGLPIVSSAFSVDALPFRGYNLIWNSFFRDENLQDSVDVFLDDGPDVYSAYSLLKRGKRKSDPFTSALPFPQKGPGVELPIGGYAPVGAIDTNGAFGKAGFAYSGGTATSISTTATTGSFVSSGNFSGALWSDGTAQTFNLDLIGSSGTNKALPLYADLGHTTAVTINSMREAFQIQRWYEQLARGGSRYVELVLSMFGCHTGDARLQRPEYLGGGSTPIQVHSVVQASETNTTPQGNLAGYGVAAANDIGFSKSFVEHGYVFGLVSVRGDYGYQQGIDRMWSRRTKFDYYWPAFAHLGEVPVLNKEIYFQGNSSDNEAFGYQERWYEYRYGVNKITGKLRSGVSGSLDVWHLAQNFSSLPTLNSTFIQESPPVSRVLAVQNEPHFIFDSVIQCKCTRVMPVYSVPGLVDHF